MTTGKLSRCIAATLAVLILLTAGGAQAADRTVKIAIGSTSFAWFPLYVALGAGYFKDEGLDVQIINVPANSTPAAAMLNGSVDLGGLGVQTAFNAIDKGQPIKILTPMVTEYTSTIFVRKGLMKEAGLTRQSPIADKIKFMVGKKLASTAIGAGPHLMYRYLFKKYLNGADVDKLSEVVPIGDSAPTLAAMKRGIIDVSAFSPPVPEKAEADDIGEVLIDFIGGDVPEIKGSIYVVLVVTDEKLKTDGPMVASFVRAIERANQLATKDIIAAGNAAKVMMGAMESDLYNQGVRAMAPALPKTAVTSIQGLQTFMDLLVDAGYKFENVNVKKITANYFVEQALKEKK
jgi:ABC-type nitrate/sulfonate/bicarbonate transport system substrate-binding protein